MNVFGRLQQIDRRIIYTLLFIVMIGSFFVRGVSQTVSPSTQDVYDRIEELAADNAKPGAKPKIALIVADSGGATVGENVPQMELITEHLMRHNIKVAFMSFVPQGKEIGEDVGTRVAKAMGKTYGEDWCNLGYYMPLQVVYQMLVQNFYDVVKQDMRNTPVTQIPMMTLVGNIHDIGFIFHVTGSESLMAWLLYVRNDIRAPLTGGCTGVINAEYANYYATGQLHGFLGGMAGAAEYESLMGIMGRATRAMQVQNYGHILIIVFIVLGNIGYFATRKKVKGQGS